MPRAALVRLLSNLVSMAVVVGVAGASAAGCLLTNINSDDCSDDDACIAAFGYGSSCNDGFCSEPISCNSGHDCRIAFGGGACVEGRCSDKLPPDPLGACSLLEPDDLGSRSLIGDDAPVVVGGMFRLEGTSDPRRANGARLALREINDSGGLLEGREIAMVVCDNGGPDDGLLGDERRDRIHGVLDYLAGTLGVPFIIGPGSSSDALTTINHLVSQSYPTLMISPSATSPALTNQSDRLSEDDELGLFWRTAPSDALQGEVLATTVVGTYPTVAPIEQVSVVFLSDAYGEGLTNVFQVAHGAASTSLHPYDEGANFTALAEDVAGDTPDAVMVVAIDAADAVALISAMAAIPALTTIPVYLTDGSKDAEALLDPSLSAAAKAIIYGNVVGTAPAQAEGEAFNTFAANYNLAFDEDPSDYSFTANAYDGAWVGAAGVVFASQAGNNYDGRNVAAGLARLIDGDPFAVGRTDWPAIKSALTSGSKTLDISGVTGQLDFDPSVGEPPAPIEVWKPSDVATECNNDPPCFVQLIVAPF